MTHDKTTEKNRSSGQLPVSSVHRDEPKGPRERTETPREHKGNEEGKNGGARGTGGQNTPTAMPGRSRQPERERRGGRASFGGYQGL